MISNSKKNRRLIQSSKTVVFFAGAELTGSLKSKHKIHIDGTVNGEVHAEISTSIGKTGTVSGVVCSEQVLVSGRIDGDVECDKLRILEGATVKGRVWCNLLRVEIGGSFIGKKKPRRLSTLARKDGRVPRLRLVENKEPQSVNEKTAAAKAATSTEKESEAKEAKHSTR